MTTRWVWLGLFIVVASTEVALRRAGVLPSMVAMPRGFVPDGRPTVRGLQADTPACVELDSAQPPPQAWSRVVAADQGAPLKMLVVGDSVTLGRGVNPEETWAVRLGERLAQATGRPVEVVNAGVNASGYCGAFRMLDHHLAHQAFDKVVVGLFADDLEQRAVLLDAGQVRANPEAVDGLVGWLAARSYTFNWVWLQVLKRAVDSTTRGGQSPGPHVLGPGRSVPAKTLDNLRSAILHVGNLEPLYLLNPPAGQGLCEDYRPDTECDWMVKDLDLMADILDTTGARWVDNREIFSENSDGFTIASERAWFRRDGRLPVHPSASGHERIAESVPQAWLTGRP